MASGGESESDAFTRPPKPKCPRAEKQPTLHHFGFTGSTAAASGASTRAIAVAPRRLKVYTANDIDVAKGIEKEYRMFWNAQVLLLDSDPAARHRLRNNSGIVGAIKTKWRLYKVDVLQVKYDELSKLLAVCFRDEAKIAEKLDAAQRNLTRMNTAREAVHSIYQEFQQACTPQDRKVLQARLAEGMGEIRKSQDAFEKVYKRRIFDISCEYQRRRYIQSTTDLECGPCASSDIDTRVEEDEIQEMAREIREEDAIESDTSDFQLRLQEEDDLPEGLQAEDVEESSPGLPGMSSYLSDPGDSD